MPPSPGYNSAAGSEPVEFSVDDAMLNTWVDDSSVYLKLDVDATPLEAPAPDQS